MAKSSGQKPQAYNSFRKHRDTKRISSWSNGAAIMNRHIREKLSDVVKINEQFARSTRIDSDNIDQSGFIYSESNVG